MTEIPWEPAGPPYYVMGLDLGRSQDHTALVVLERLEMVRRKRDPVTGEFERWIRLALRHLERVPLQTPYPDVVGLVRDVVRTVKRVSDVVVDATGVGSPVVDLLRRADLKCSVIPVTITGGDSESVDGSGYRVPKRDLMTGLQVAFEKRWLGVCDCGESTDALLEELRATRMTVSANGTVRWGAGRGHDDLVMAAALAWWRVRRVWRVG